MTKTKKTSKKTVSKLNPADKPKPVSWGIDPEKYAAARKPARKPAS